MSTDASRTHHASQAVALSQLVELKFAKLELGGRTSRSLTISTPDGPSTGGGRQARQSLVLKAPKGKGNDIVCGFIDGARGVAEMRSFVVLDKQNRDRFDKPLDFMRVDYDAFVAEMVKFLTAQGIDARVSNEKLETKKAGTVAPPPRTTGSLNPVLTLVIGFALGLATGYVIFTQL